MPARPTGGVTSYTYDAAGQQLTETDPDGQVSVFGYDQLGREISENDYSSQAEYDNDPGDPDETLTWTYNAAGQLASESDQIFYGSGSSSTTSYTYDAFGRTESETQATSGAPTVEFDYTYDANGNVLTETDWAAGALVETTTYSGYNGLNLPAMVVVATTAATLTIDYQYSSVGQTEQMTRYQDGELVDTTTYTYDGDGNLSEEKAVGPSGSTLEDFQYVYNGEGEIVTAITPTQGYVEYTYDAAGQLTSATYPNTPWANESYSYDAAGNRTSTTTGSTIDDTQQTAASTTTTGNELTSDGTFVYEYDADGNLIYQARISQAYSADDQTFYSYNNQNELIDVCTEDNGDTITQMVTYSYNAAGQRVSESVTVGQNTTTTDFVYDLSGNAVLTFDGSEAGDLTGQYVYGQAVDQLLAQTDSSGNVSWMITDRDESVRDVLESSGGTTSVIDHIDYKSFGETITETAPSTPHLTGYAGYVNDLALGMLETDSRVYDASIGRFISQDPSGFAGSANGNLYEYTSNSPLSNVDPSGLSQVNPVSSVLSSIPVVSMPIDFGDDGGSDGSDDDDESIGPSQQSAATGLLGGIGSLASAYINNSSLLQAGMTAAAAAGAAVLSAGVGDSGFEQDATDESGESDGDGLLSQLARVVSTGASSAIGGIPDAITGAGNALDSLLPGGTYLFSYLAGAINGDNDFDLFTSKMPEALSSVLWSLGNAASSLPPAAPSGIQIVPNSVYESINPTGSIGAASPPDPGNFLVLPDGTVEPVDTSVYATPQQLQQMMDSQDDPVAPITFAQPDSMTWGDVASVVGQGLAVGGTANINALANTLANTVTLGQMDWNPIAVPDYYQQLGYDASYGIQSTAYNFLAGAATGSIGGNLGTALNAWDAAGNAVGVGQGIIDIGQNGLSAQNAIQTVAGLAGLAGNILPVVTGSAQGNLAPSNVAPGGRVFYGTPNGQLIEAPAGYRAVTAENGKGLVLLPEGQALGNNRNVIRYGEPNPQNPNGYFRYYNDATPNGQPLIPSTGSPGSNAATHIPLDYQGPMKGYPGR